MFSTIFLTVSLAYGLPIGLLDAICFVESSNTPTKIHRQDGNSSSIGICQIKYTTAAEHGYSGQPKGLLDPPTNIKYAGRYLAYQLKRYKGNYAKAVTAYNQGTCYKHGGSEYLAKVFTEFFKRRKYYTGGGY